MSWLFKYGLSLTLLAGFAPRADTLAAPISTQFDPNQAGRRSGPGLTVTYSTSAIFGPSGSASIPGVSFRGVDDQTIQTAAPFPNWTSAWASFNGSSSSGGTADFPIGRVLVSLPSQGTSEFGGVLWVLLRVDAIDGVRLAAPLVSSSPIAIYGALQPNGEWRLGYGAADTLPGLPFTPPYPISDGFQYNGIGHHLLFPSGRSWTTTDQEISLESQLLSVSATNVPEPSTWLVGSVLALAAWRARRR